MNSTVEGLKRETCDQQLRTTEIVEKGCRVLKIEQIYLRTGISGRYKVFITHLLTGVLDTVRGFLLCFYI